VHWINALKIPKNRNYFKPALKFYHPPGLFRVLQGYSLLIALAGFSDAVW